MCTFCSQGVPACGVDGSCGVSVFQQIRAVLPQTTVFFGGFLAAIKGISWKRNSKKNKTKVNWKYLKN